MDPLSPRIYSGLSAQLLKQHAGSDSDIDDVEGEYVHRLYLHPRSAVHRPTTKSFSVLIVHDVRIQV